MYGWQVIHCGNHDEMRPQPHGYITLHLHVKYVFINIYFSNNHMAGKLKTIALLNAVHTFFYGDSYRYIGLVKI